MVNEYDANKTGNNKRTLKQLNAEHTKNILRLRTKGAEYVLSGINGGEICGARLINYSKNFIKYFKKRTKRTIGLSDRNTKYRLEVRVLSDKTQLVVIRNK